MLCTHNRSTGFEIVKKGTHRGGGDIPIHANEYTDKIMVHPLYTGSYFGYGIEAKLSAWGEENGMHAYVQASFQNASG